MLRLGHGTAQEVDAKIAVFYFHSLSFNMVGYLDG